MILWYLNFDLDLLIYKAHRKIAKKNIAVIQLAECDEHINTLRCFSWLIAFFSSPH